MNAQLLALADLIRAETGITIKAAQHASLEAAARRIDPNLTPTNALLAASGSAGATALLEQLIDEMSNKETFFLRQRVELDAIDWPLLLQNARSSGSEHTRVWAAACATGEEPYSLAILACQAFHPAPPPVSIHATDMSATALATAQRGWYGRRATRLLDESIINRYFKTEGAELVVGERLHGIVQFSRQNLVRDLIPAGGPFDLVVCRNVLIYFDAEATERVLAALLQALSPRGTLVLGAADRLCCSASQLLRMHDSKPDGQHLVQRLNPARTMRRPLGSEQPNTVPITTRGPVRPPPDTELEAALEAANIGDLELAADITARILKADPLNPEAYFIRGLAHRGLGRAEEAVQAFRSALYVDPGFGVAAFEMGRAHEARGDTTAAVAAYTQTLRALELTRRTDSLDAEAGAGDVAAACAIRLGVLRASPPRARSRSGIGKRTS